MKLLLGCIADDYTGASDLANTLAKSGLRTAQLIGLPEDDALFPDVEAVVIALKSRSNSPTVAVEESLNALQWLQENGARQFFFKYCSTFDSTTKGNIGPVMDALMRALGSSFIIACPAFPRAGRTVYQGHLFVYNELLSDSSMRNHPTTPMTDSNLVRFLGKQTKQRIGLIPIATVEQGPETINTAMSELQEAGVRIAIVDAISDHHLMNIGVASKNLELITGGSGAAMGLADNFMAQSGIQSNDTAVKIPSVSGPEAVISGSCSQTTLAQVAKMSQSHPVFRFNAIELAEGRVTSNKILEWASPYLVADQAFLVAASASPELIRKAQEFLGRSEAGELIEKTLAEVARLLVKNGLRRLLVAGGETSGAVVQALGIKGFQIGQEIEPGVPCMVTLSEEPIALTLKSGNFGSEDFFLKALREMP
jgi:3-dehydrotetronate 4-kinase